MDKMLKTSKLLQASDTEDPDLIILRGLPGSGKSTLAKTMIGRFHVEADQFFELGGKGYNFDASKLRQAHEWCQEQVKKALQEGKKVVVSNTFTQKWEFKSYIDTCRRLGKTFKVMRATGNYKNIHGVPEDAMERMRQRWEPYEG